MTDLFLISSIVASQKNQTVEELSTFLKQPIELDDKKKCEIDQMF